jgi:hypothetical protein
MKITYRVMLIGVAALGLGFGISFGAGVAYGHGNPKAQAGGLTQQQLNSLLGITTGQVTGGGGTSGQGNGAAATAVAGRGGAGGALQTLNSSPSGQITAIDGNTITIQARTGSEKINVSSGTTIQKLATGSLSDLKVGDSIVASGSRGSDGSFNATAVSPLPPELQALFGGGGNGAQATPTGR